MCQKIHPKIITKFIHPESQSLPEKKIEKIRNGLASLLWLFYWPSFYGWFSADRWKIMHKLEGFLRSGGAA